MKFLMILTVLLYSGSEAGRTPGQVIDSTLNDVRANFNHKKCGACLIGESPNPGCDCTNLKPRKDCLEFYKQGFKINGIYRLTSKQFLTTTNAYCDQTTEGGGWTVIQRRKDGSVDFDRPWADYKNGFGKLTGEFWFGNDMIHHLTSNGSQLLINMKMYGHTMSVYSKYTFFEVENEQEKYKLKISGKSGTTNYDSMRYHNGMKFSTFDQDNDGWSSGTCSVQQSGGWWYKACAQANLNGRYSFKKKSGEIYWWLMNKNQPEFVEIKVRKGV